MSYWRGEVLEERWRYWRRGVRGIKGEEGGIGGEKGVSYWRRGGVRGIGGEGWTSMGRVQDEVEGV